MSIHAIVAVVVVGLVAIGAGIFLWVRHLAAHLKTVKDNAMRLKASAQSEVQKVQKAL